MLEEKLIGKVLDRTLEGGADFAEVFVEDSRSTSARFVDRKLERFITGHDSGAGVRAIYGRMQVYAHTSDLAEKSLLRAARAVAEAHEGEGEGGERARLVYEKTESPHKVEIDPASVERSERVEFLKRCDAAARATDALVTQVDAGLAEKRQRVLVANSRGRFVEDERTYVRAAVSVVASREKEKQTAYESEGRHGGFEAVRSTDPEKMSRRSAERAVRDLNADYVRAGTMPVLLGPAFGGVIFHEACGHALETTAISKEASVFAGKLGERIAAEVVSACDDGTIPGGWGSTTVDDEGTLTERTILIERGVLKSYMADILGSIITGHRPTGSGRRQSYSYPPTSRMRNTFIMPGEHSFDEMLAAAGQGLYAEKMGGGSVSPGTGEFNFKVASGRMIRAGKLAEPVRGATLIGRGQEVILRVKMVGKDLDFAPGYCGSESGSIPAGVGQPHVLVGEMVVGGRQ